MTPDELSARDARQEERRRSFDAAAEAYDTFRVGYADALFDSLCAKLPPPARVLEIASGTGHATLPMAQRGYEIHCIELGEKLAAVARQKLAAYPNVRIEVGRFEETAVEANSADLVLIGSAFHWLKHAQAMPKIAAALRPGGLLALVWNAPPPRDPHDAFTAATRATYLKHAPELLEERTRESAPARMANADPAPGILLGNPAFTDFSREVFTEKKTLTTHALLGMLGTFSNVLTLPSDKRDALFGELREVVDGQFGGQLEREFRSVLQLARRR